MFANFSSLMPLFVALLACGGTRELDQPSPPPVMPSELLHTLRQAAPATGPLGAVPPEPEPAAPDSPVPVTAAPPNPDGAAPAPALSEEPTP